jgi:hypothetical protein
MTRLTLLSLILPLTVACSSASTPASPPDASHPSDADSHDATQPPVDAWTYDATPPPPYVGGPIAAQMNDVSVLFPLPTTKVDIDNLLTASSTGARGPLVPKNLYASIGPIAGSSPADAGANERQPSIAEYQSLRVVAMRIDPCFASLTLPQDGVGCDPQLRLIFQELTEPVGAPGVDAFDSALHAFYSLTRSELLTVAQALVALREANADKVSFGPLAPHPVMVRQGLDGPMSQGVRALILQYAGAQNLVRVAQLNTFSGIVNTWGFRADDVTSATTAKTTPFVIPTLSPDAGALSQTVTLSFNGAPGMFLPPTLSADNLEPLDDSCNSLSACTPAFNALVRVENPSDHSSNTIDCVSCHSATSIESLIAMPQLALDDRTSPLAFQPTGASVTAADMAPTPGNLTVDDAKTANVHAFSYFSTNAGISQRVVNETAAIVQYLNGLP